MDTDILDSVLDPGPTPDKEPEVTPQAQPPDSGTSGEDGSVPNEVTLQSKLDTANAENQTLEQRLAALESVAPLARYVDQNPRVLDHLDAMTALDNGLMLDPEQKDIPVPEMPERPTEFDNTEATDPNTPSGKYYLDLQEYNAKAQQRLLSESARQEKHREAVAERISKNAQEREYREELNTRLTGQYGLETADVGDFWNFMLDPKNLSEANMVAYFKANRVNGEPEVPETPATPTGEETVLAQQAAAQGVRLNIPQPAAIGAGADSGGGQQSEQDMFIGSLVKPETDTGLIF